MGAILVQTATVRERHRVAQESVGSPPATPCILPVSQESILQDSDSRLGFLRGLSPRSSGQSSEIQEGWTEAVSDSS